MSARTTRAGCHRASDSAGLRRAGHPPVAAAARLKQLAAAGLLESLRGAKGGYRLVRSPGSISVAEIVHALEGPIALMACTAGPGHCEQETRCTVQEPWHRINRAVHDALSRVTLADLACPVGGAALLAIQNAAVRVALPHPNN